MKKTIIIYAIIISSLSLFNMGTYRTVLAATNIPTVTPDVFGTYKARPPIHNLFAASTSPQGLTPQEAKGAYHLPDRGGAGTIAIITAYDHPFIESDLAVFTRAFSLPPCTVASKCLEIHKMATKLKTNTDWSMETALDTQWSHAVATEAKILVVEAVSDHGADLMKAVDYARNRKDVVSVSMSWGGDEFAGETKLDEHFTSLSSSSPIAYFASSGDDGTGASWPAVSPNVVAVGGTSLAINDQGQFFSESGWSGSGGGISMYEKEPAYQTDYSIPRATGKRAIPDVSYAADPRRGFSVYHVDSNTIAKSAPRVRGWYVIGGTSAGSPQWAAIAALSSSIKSPISLAKLYADKASATYDSIFRDIKTGENGTCTYYCVARKHYDYITGLGSPLTYKF